MRTSTGEYMGSAVKKREPAGFVRVACTFLCVIIVAFVLELMRFEQNNPSVYSFSLHCSLLSACTPVGGRGSCVQDVNSCLRCALGLLEVAALFHEVHNFPSSCRIPPLRHAGRVSKYLKYHLLCNYLASPFLLAERREREEESHIWMSQTNPRSSSCCFFPGKF